MIRAWNGFKRRSVTDSSDPIQVMFEFEKVLQAVRSDLGHKSGALAQDDLLGLFINDIHEHLPREELSDRGCSPRASSSRAPPAAGERG